MSADAQPGTARASRRVAWITIAAIATLVALAWGPALLGQARVAWWRGLAPHTPFGRVVRIEFRVDNNRLGDEVIAGGTLATWSDRAIVRELTSLAPWTSRGLGYAYRCTEGSPFHLIFVTEAGRELDVLLACDSCASAEPVWRDGRAGWTVPELLTRVGELLINEPVAQAYADRYDEERREYHARWLYWAQDPWDVHVED